MCVHTILADCVYSNTCGHFKDSPPARQTVTDLSGTRVVYIVSISISGWGWFQAALTAWSETLMPKYAMWSVLEVIVGPWAATSQLLPGNGRMKD